VRVPENGGTQIRIYHWYRTADENDRLCVLARDIDGEVQETFLFPWDPRDLDLATYAPDDGDNTCQKNMPGFAIGLGPDDPNRIRESRFDIPPAFDGKVIELRFVLGSNGSGHEGPGHSYTGWFISRFEYAGTDQHRGDCNGDRGVDVSDLVYLLNYLFIKGPDPASLGDAGSAGNVNCEGDVDAADLVYLLNYLFIDGPPPPCSP
jgi:hypothetical protein